MTQLDDYDLWPPPEAREPVPTPRRHRHVWEWRKVRPTPLVNQSPTTELEMRCRFCNVIRDEAKARRGKSSRRLGHDGERRSEKRYGWRKVGEFGGIADLEGTLAVVQQKTSRRAPPPAWMSIFRALEGRSGGRIPLLLLSFVRVGVDTEDFVVIRGRDWLALHGQDAPE